ncbi:MAG TPA: tetratricopeptide repeat protein [Armatimonadetes bacterium]|nr:tetratricopeptide repeat protein [Armatimonadota bacterium]
MPNISELLERADEHRINGEYEEAIALYDQILGEEPEHAKARHGRALCYCFTGLFDESVQELEEVRRLAPDYIKAREDLFKTYLMLGMYDEGLKEMYRILLRDPNNEEVHKHSIYFDNFDPNSFEDDGL